MALIQKFLLAHSFSNMHVTERDINVSLCAAKVVIDISVPLKHVG